LLIATEVINSEERDEQGF